MEKYIKILFESFFVDKKFHLQYIFLSVILLIIWLGNIEIIRKLILSIEKNSWFNITLNYWFFAILLIIILFLWNMYKVKFRPISLNLIQKYFHKKYLNKYILLNNEKVNNYWTWKFINIFSWIVSMSEILYILLFDLSINIISYIFSIIMVWYINIYLVLPIILITILLVLSMSFTSTKTFQYRKNRKWLWEQESRQVIKIIMEKFTILKNWWWKREIDKLLKIKDNIKDESINISFYVKLLEELSNFIIGFWEISLILIIWYFIYKSEASYADIWALLFIMAIIKKNISLLSDWYRQIINYSNDFIRLVDIFEEIPEIKNYEKWKEYKHNSWEIEIKNLKYKYPDWKKVFEELNLEIPKKSKVAFIWRSWSWKSTLVKLILWFIEKDSWEILIDNQEIDELSKKSYYKHIWYLSQEPNVFDWTVLENIIYWSNIFIENNKIPDIIPEIIKLASCEFIYELPKWLDTEIWEKWIKLSWWERQRLAIARLFLQNPNIIILDEPTSALDSFSEENISKALENLSKWKTMITIAHRLQTIKKSDKIFIFEKWKIVDSGNHNELIQKSEVYKTLVDLQNGKIIE